MDIGRSFTYMFDDEKWLSKILIGGIINMVPILNFASWGDMLEATENTAEDLLSLCLNGERISAASS